MKPLERRMADNFSFQIGSALDRAKEWSFEEEKVLASSNERKVPSKHLLVFKMEKRRGKPVYLVGPFFLEKEQMSLVCSTIKKRLGSGGTCKEDWMEFQGDCKEKLKMFLQEEGFRFKG